MNTAKHVFKLTEAVASLLRKALSRKDEEGARYYAGELRRIGSLFFEQPETAIPPTQPRIISEEKTKEKQEVEAPKKEKRMRNYNLHKPLSSNEKTLLTAVLLSENMPDDREKLARVIYQDTMDNMPSQKRRIFFVRNIQTLGFGLAKLRFILKTGSCGETDRDFLGSIRGRYPNITMEQFEQIAVLVFEKYEVKIPDVWIWEGSGDNENGIAVKPNLKRKQKTRPVSEWSQILYAAFFHPDGPSLDPAVVSERTQIEPALAEPMLAGALETIELEWSGNGQNDRQAQELIAMLQDKWPDKSFAEIIAICKEE